MIKFLDLKSVNAQHRNKLISAFQRVLDSGQYILGEQVSLFEENFAQYCNVKKCIGVGNGLDALSLILRGYGIGDGDEVLVPSNTYIASWLSISQCGAMVVPVEPMIATYNIDPDLIEKNITKNTKAIMPTQLNGRVADMDVILQIADKYNLQVYEDSAQALGAKYKGKSAGSFGIGGCISFYPAKVLGCFGDGGAVLTNDEAIYKTIKLMRDHGRGEDGNVSVWGYNSRLDNLQAAILNYFFDDYKTIVQRRRAIANLYAENLKNLKSVILPPAVDSHVNNFDIYQNYEIEAEKRDKLKEYLSGKGVGTLIQWGGKAVHEFRDLGFNQSLPFTEKIMRNSLMLPLNMTVTDDEVKYICKCVRDFYND